MKSNLTVKVTKEAAYEMLRSEARCYPVMATMDDILLDDIITTWWENWHDSPAKSDDLGDFVMFVAGKWEEEYPDEPENETEQTAPTGPAWAQKQYGHVTEEADSYPLCQWYNGDGKNDLFEGVGGFAIPVDSVGNDWPLGERQEYTYNDRTTGEIFSIVRAEVVVIAKRLDWYLGERNKPEWQRHYEKDKGMKGRNQWLLFFRGAEAWHTKNGPLKLSLHGVNGVRMSKNVFRTFKDKVLTKAGRLPGMNRQLDDYTFWCPIVADERQEANPNYPMSLITPPKLDMEIPETDEALLALCDRQYIGDDLMEVAASWWDQCQKWAKAPIAGVADTSVKEFGYTRYGPDGQPIGQDPIPGFD